MLATWKNLSKIFYICAALLLSTLYAPCYGQPSSGVQQGAPGSDALEATLAAIKRALDWLESVHTQVNLDAVIGTRLVEGQFGVLLTHLNVENGYVVSSDIYQQIQAIQQQADRVSDLATPFVKLTQPEYYQRLAPILAHAFWHLDKPSRDVPREMIDRPRYQGEAMHEADSDDCLVELFGSGDEGSQTCQVSQPCWKRMTQPGYRSYSLSHEVFYLEIGEQFGCFRGQVIPMVDKLAAGFCANMYQEAMDIAKAGLQSGKKDLFMEIPALCGMLGYRQFFKDDWLQHILNWQLRQGCWSTSGTSADHVAPGDRFKREERTLLGGCQCHRTAVALGALSQYTRYIIEYMNAAGATRR